MSTQAIASPAPVELGVGAGAALLLVGVIGLGMTEIGAQPLMLNLYGDLDRVDPAAVAAVAEPALQRGFFMLDSDALEARLASIPWVRQATVERLWPDRVAIHLDAHEPWARWGDDRVLTRDGALLNLPAALSLDLRVEAPDENLAQVLVDLGRMERACAGFECELRAWKFAASGDVAATLAHPDGRLIDVEFGREDLAGQIATLFRTALPVLEQRIETVSRIDLRYRNGFAVRWQDVPEDNER